MTDYPSAEIVFLRSGTTDYGLDTPEWRRSAIKLMKEHIKYLESKGRTIVYSEELEKLLMEEGGEDE